MVDAALAVGQREAAVVAAADDGLGARRFGERRIDRPRMGADRKRRDEIESHRDDGERGHASRDAAGRDSDRGRYRSGADAPVLPNANLPAASLAAHRSALLGAQTRFLFAGFPGGRPDLNFFQFQY